MKKHLQCAARLFAVIFLAFAISSCSEDKNCGEDPGTNPGITIDQDSQQIEFAALRRETPSQTIYVRSSANWSARLESTDATATVAEDWLTLTVDQKRSTIVVSPKNNNLTAAPRSGRVIVYDTDDDTSSIEITISQLNDTEVLDFSRSFAQHNMSNPDEGVAQYAIYAMNSINVSDLDNGTDTEGAILFYIDILFSDQLYLGWSWFDAKMPSGRYIIAETSEPGTILPGELLGAGSMFEMPAQTFMERNELIDGELTAVNYFMKQGYVDIQNDGDFYSVYYNFTDEQGTPWRAIFEGEFATFNNYSEKPFISNLTQNVASSVNSVEAYYQPRSEYNPDAYWRIFMLEEGTTFEREWGMDIVQGTAGYTKLNMYWDDYSGVIPTELPVGTFRIESGGHETIIPGSNQGSWDGSWYFSLTDPYDPAASVAPLVGGTVTIAKDETTGNFTITLDCMDDTMSRVGGPFKVISSYTGQVNIIQI